MINSVYPYDCRMHSIADVSQSQVLSDHSRDVALTARSAAALATHFASVAVQYSGALSSTRVVVIEQFAVFSGSFCGRDVIKKH